jgi:hypothetical protein
LGLLDNIFPKEEEDAVVRGPNRSWIGTLRAVTGSQNRQKHLPTFAERINLISPKKGKISMSFNRPNQIGCCNFSKTEKKIVAHVKRESLVIKTMLISEN